MMAVFNKKYISGMSTERQNFKGILAPIFYLMSYILLLSRDLGKYKIFACVVGFVGTGKSYLLGATYDMWEAADFRVQG